MKQSEKQQLRLVAGDLSGLYGFRHTELCDGRGRGMRAIELWTDKGLRLTVAPDRGLDIPYASYKGVNIGLVTKAGLSSPAFYAADGERGFLKQFNAGLLTTAGLFNAGDPSEYNGVKYGLHGDIDNSPAENVCAFEQVIDDEVVLTVTGDVRQSCAFGEAMVLHRSLLIHTQSSTVEVRDSVENQGFEPQGIVNLYHVNFGYPLLDAGARCYFSTPEVSPRTDTAKKNIAGYSLMEAPEVGRDEECFFHTGSRGPSYGMVVNDKLGIACAVHYDADVLPWFIEWKCPHGGDYALGMEPSLTSISGRAGSEALGEVPHIAPGDHMDFAVSIQVLSDAAEIDALAGKCKEYR